METHDKLFFYKKGLNCGFGEWDAEVRVLTELMIMHFYQGVPGFLDRGELEEGHLAVFPGGGDSNIFL